MRLMFTRWQQYLRNSLAKHSSVKEYKRTDSLKGVSTSATPNERSNMSNDHNWIHDIIPRKQAEAMELSGDALIANLKDGVQLIVSASNQSAIDLCKAWELTKSGHEDGFETIAMFVNGLVATLEMYLLEEDIDPYEEYEEED